MTEALLTPETIVSLARYFSADSTLVKNARAQCAPGEHAIRGGVQLAGVLKVGDDYTALATPRLSGLHVLTLVVVQLVEDGVLPKTSALALASRVLDAALEAPQSDEALAASKSELVVEIAKTKTQVQKRIAERLPREPRAGRVAFNGFAEGLAPRKGFAAGVNVEE